MGLFGDLDIASAEDVVSGIKPGPYPAVIEECVLQEGSTNNPDGKFLVFTYNNPQWPFPLKEFKEIPQGSPDTWDKVTKVNTKGEPDPNGKTKFERNVDAMKYLKARLVSLGLPVSRINSFSDPSEFKGLNVVVTVRLRNGYTNVGNVELPKSSGVTLTPTPTPTANNPSAGAPNAGLTKNPFAI